MKWSFESNYKSQNSQSMSNSSGNLNNRKIPPHRRCFCPASTPIRTSWTDCNPGRRFVSCEFKGDQNCGYFEWVDPPICERSKVIIPRLLRKLKRIEEEKESLKRMKKMFLNLIIISWLLFLCMLLYGGKVGWRF